MGRAQGRRWWPLADQGCGVRPVQSLASGRGTAHRSRAGPMGERADDTDRRDPAEADRLRDEALKRALATPPKPQEEMKLGKPRGKPAGKIMQTSHGGSDEAPNSTGN